LVLLQPLLPQLGPARAGVLLDRRQGVHGHHRAAVGADVVVHAHVAAWSVVAVVGVAVVSGVHGDDGLQARRPLHGHLDAGEAAVGGPEHAHVAVAPRLFGAPLDGIEAVPLLDGHVLVGVDALRAARAADVEADADEAALGEVVVCVVDAVGQVVLTVRDVLDDGPQAPA